MFTGIVEEVGTVKDTGPDRLQIGAANIFDDLKLGDSVAVNGVCLTVTIISGNTFTVDVMPETFRRTGLGGLRRGTVVNLERAMPATGRFGGHFVEGHIDDTGKVLSLKPEGEAVIARIEAPAQVMRYIVTRGFIAVNGVSLTVVDYDASSFSVSLVSFTRENTVLGKARQGDTVNLEVDIIAKYIEKYSRSEPGGITMEFLAENNFLE